MKTSSYLIMYMSTSPFFLSFFLSFLSPRLSAVIGVLFAAAALSSPTKRDIATTSIHSNPNGNASKIDNRHDDFNI